MIWHVGTQGDRKPPPVNYKETAYIPALTYFCSTAALDENKEKNIFALHNGDHPIVCAFKAAEPELAETAELMQLGLLSLRRLVKQDVVVRLARPKGSNGVMPRPQFLKTLSVVNEFSITIFAGTDPRTLRVARHVGHLGSHDMFTIYFRARRNFLNGSASKPATIRSKRYDRAIISLFNARQAS
jgi:hypothetical protein